MNRRALVSAAIVGAFVVSATGAWLSVPGGSGDGREGELEAAVPHAVTPGQTVSFPPYQIPEDELSGWMNAATDADRAIIADGVLSFEEYGAMVAATLACMEAAGISVVHSRGYGRADGIEPGPRLSARGVYSYFGAITTYSPTRPAASFATIDACKAGSAQVEFLWAQHTAPSEPELQAMRNHMAECLERAGASLPANPSDLELRRMRDTGAVQSQAYRECQFQAADAFELDRLPG